MSEQSQNEWAQVVLRIGLAGMYLWFGISQVSNPGGWTSWLPTWINILPLSDIQAVMLNGFFEIALSILLILGFWTRLVAFILSIHILFIAYEIGYNDIGIRDAALGLATLSLALFTPGKFTLDREGFGSVQRGHKK